MIKAGEISEIIKRQIAGYEAEVDLQEVGRVIEVGDGIARIYGLEKAMAGELLEFPGDVIGMVLNLERTTSAPCSSATTRGIKEGDNVKRTGRIAEVPVGEALLGRVVNALGQPVDGKGPITDHGVPRRSSSTRPASSSASRCKEPLQTGIKAIDAMIPIGRGQRELIIGDRQTGKTARRRRHDHQPEGPGRHLHLRRDRPEAVDGRAGRASVLEDAGAMDYTIVVVASASEPAPLQYIAPYAGRRDGRVLPRQRAATRSCIYDDLSKHATAYRQLSLLLRRPPGREAYPGDVFYLHRRLLERAAKLSDEHGRRLAHRAADHRDAGRRRVGLHPDQRHLDHRRPDLPRGRPLLRRRPAGRQRRHLGVARRRRRADQGDEEGRRHAAPRPRAVPRAGGVRAVRLRPRRGDADAARARRAPGRDPEAGPVRAAAGREPGRRSSTPAPTATSTTCRSTRCAQFETEFLDVHARARSSRDRSTEIRDKKEISTPTHESASRRRSTDVQGGVHGVEGHQGRSRDGDAPGHPAPHPRRSRTPRRSRRPWRWWPRRSCAGRRSASIAARPYAEKLARAARRPRRRGDRTASRTRSLEQRDGEAASLLVVITADRGLAGAFNSNMIRGGRCEFVARVERDRGRRWSWSGGKAPRLLPAPAVHDHAAT